MAHPPVTIPVIMVRLQAGVAPPDIMAHHPLDIMVRHPDTIQDINIVGVVYSYIYKRREG
jgi:hypothetical protein